MGSTRAQATRDRITAVAFELLREHGTAGMTMRQVALGAELSLSNVQYHFKSREALLVGVTEHHLAACRDALLAAVGPPERVTLRSVLRASLTDPRVLEVAPPFRELFAKALTEPGVRERLHAYYMRSLEGLVELLRQTSRKPRKRLEEVATVLMTAIEGAYLLEEITPVSGKRLATVLEQVATSMLE